MSAGFAQSTVTTNVTVSAAVAARASLTLSSNTVSFPDSDPATVPSITASALSIDARASTSAGSTVSLTVQSSGDLTSGTDTIAVSNVTWTSTGGGYQAGTMNSATAQTLGSWTNSGNRSGTQTYALANSWNYAIGNYSTTVTYTLTAP